MPSEPLILYSAITRLAYYIGEKFYDGVHYVWGAPRPSRDPHTFFNPPSSEPLTIYWRYHDDVRGGDNHSSLIEQNRTGLIRGASEKAAAGLIEVATRTLIETMAKQAPLAHFSPLLLVIPFDKVRSIAKPAELSQKAALTSEEYQIELLPRACFDVLEIHR